jgi:hypothetical protein
MDYCKTKQFIAFINKTGRDRFWCDGYFAWDEYAPNIHPYDTKEQKKIAAEIADGISSWSESGEIEGVVLTVSQEVITFVNKSEKESALERFEKRSADGIRKQEEDKKKLLEEKKKKKESDPEHLGGEILEAAQISEISVVTKKPKVVDKVVEPIEKKRSPLEIKNSSKEKEKKDLPTPSEPKKKSRLSNIIKEKK